MDILYLKRSLLTVTRQVIQKMIFYEETTSYSRDITEKTPLTRCVTWRLSVVHLPEEVRDPHGDCGVQGNCFRGFRCSCPWWRYVRVTSSSIVCPGVSHVMLNPNLSSGLPLFSQACIWAINYWIILKILLSKLLLHNPRNLLRHFNTK